MTVLERITILLVTTMAAVICAQAVVGCLTDVERLVPRADAILVGRIDSITSVRLEDCPAPVSSGDRAYSTYLRCGDVNEAIVIVEKQLKGRLEEEIAVLVASEGVLTLSCDDRPSMEQMGGLYALLFLERFEGRWWTLDGPNSIHASRTAVPQHGRYIQRVKRLLETGRRNENE